MAKNEDIARAIAADPYLKARKAPTEAELVLCQDLVQVKMRN